MQLINKNCVHMNVIYIVAKVLGVLAVFFA